LPNSARNDILKLQNRAKYVTKEIIKEAKDERKNILKKRIILRSLPELRFYLDDSITYGIKISQILSDINTKTNE